MIYFISNGTYTKIGKADDPKKILKELQTGCPEKLEIKITKKKVSSKSRLHINTVYNLWNEDEIQETLEEYNNWLREFKNK